MDLFHPWYAHLMRWQIKTNKQNGYGISILKLVEYLKKKNFKTSIWRIRLSFGFL
jgi:hypothetical protein